MTAELIVLAVILAFMTGWVVIEYAASFRRRLRRRRIYSAIRANPGVRASVVAEQLRLPPTLVHALLRELEDQGSVLTLPESKRDRRCWISSK